MLTPVKTDDKIKSLNFTFLTFTPTEFPISSPNVNMSNSFTKNITQKNEITKIGMIKIKYPQPLEENEPIFQINIEDKLSFFIEVIKLRSESKNNEITMPTKITLLLFNLLSILLHKNKTKSTVKIENENPTNAYEKFFSELKPKTINNPTPKDAPDETPKVYEEANGFLKTD